MTDKSLNLRNVFTCISAFGIIITIVLCIVGYTKGIFTSSDALTVMLKSFGFAAPVVFILLQIVQVVIPIIPGGITTAAGVIIFGPWWGFVYNYFGICIGSVINFLLAKKYGQPIVKAMVKESTYNKYAKWLDEGERFTKLFTVAIFMPVAPDDFLCMLAGLTKMKLKTFVIIILLAKPISIFCYSAILALGARWFMNFL